MTAAAPRRCVLYARLSVTKEESVSIARQLESCRKYAEGRGWQVVGQFIDDGVSATSNRPEERKGWSELLRQPGGFEAVVVWKVDRLARRVLDFLNVDEVLQKRGAALVAVEDPIDMTTPMGRAFATILAVFGEMEAAAIAARVKAARAHMLKDGRWPGGGIPYGYRAVQHPGGVGRVLEKDPERIGWLTQIAGMALSGSTVNAITSWLDEQGAPVPRARKDGGTTWNRQSVDTILRNPTLAGMTPRNPGRKKSGKAVSPFNVVRDPQGDPVVNESLAIITLEEFTRLQELLDSRPGPQARRFEDRVKTSPLLSKVARCDDCDVFMCRGTNQKRPVLYCPRCRQTLSRTAFDPYLVRRLLDERGLEPLDGMTVADRWGWVGTNTGAQREILLSQLESLRIRRGVVGRRFDEDRVLLRWRASEVPAEAVAS